jgi:hypothetical protein
MVACFGNAFYTTVLGVYGSMVFMNSSLNAKDSCYSSPNEPDKVFTVGKDNWIVVVLNDWRCRKVWLLPVKQDHGKKRYATTRCQLAVPKFPKRHHI